MKIAATLAFGILAAAGGIASAQQTYPFEKVLSTADNGGFVPTSGSLDGTQKWRTQSGSAFQSVPATIDGSGNVAFSAKLALDGTLTPPIVSGVNDYGFWYGGPGSLSLQARYGDPTLDNANCGGPGAIFTSRMSDRVAISPAGHMYIGGYAITGGTTTANDRNVMWIGLSGNMKNFVRGNDVYLNVGNSQQKANITSAQNSVRISNLGQAAFLGQTKANVGDTGAFGTNDSFIGVATTGLSPLGQNSGAKVVVRTQGDLIGGGTQMFRYFDPAINHAGSVFNVYGMATGPGGVTGNDDFVLVMSTTSGGAYTNTVFGREGGNTGVGAIQYAVAPTDTNPFFGGPVSPFWPIGRQDLSNGGRALFEANLKIGVGGIDSTNNGALMSWKNGVTSIVAQKGPASAIDASLPGTLSRGIPVTAMGSGVYTATLSNSDQVAWTGALSGTGINILNDQFLAVSTIADDGSVTHHLILREGDQVPGMAPGVLWGGRGNPSTSEYPGPGNIAINASGIVIFQSFLTGTGFEDGLNNSTIWAYFPSCGTLRMLTRTGNTLPDGMLMASVGTNIEPNGEGSSSGFNDEGWFSFTVFDGTAHGAVYRVHFCPADLDDGSGTGQPDGGVDINDLLYFLGQYEQGLCGADLDGGAGNGLPDGGVDINDLLFFLAHYEGGC